ncbi:myc-associated zinc finger protein-like [Temnothorax curvispinosus]|uniref:Myc-associated zinc finger protein-like n=1 Tax=Temnothorax curvispinosus TaxID=300111 RepID=A0A6J1PYB8_9HYME|nr:myc-associated zinc finger protein-like [Temnothorax curvispinosus]
MPSSAELSSCNDTSSIHKASTRRGAPDASPARIDRSIRPSVPHGRPAANRCITARDAADPSIGATISSIISSSRAVSRRGSTARTVPSVPSTRPTCGPTCAGSTPTARSTSSTSSAGSSTASRRRSRESPTRHVGVDFRRNERIRRPLSSHAFELASTRTWRKDYNRSVANRDVMGSSRNQNARSYPCGNCNSVFSMKHNLQYHWRIECGQPPRYNCPYCAYRTKHPSNVRAHVRRIHPGNGVYVVDIRKTDPLLLNPSQP